MTIVSRRRERLARLSDVLLDEKAAASAIEIAANELAEFLAEAAGADIGEGSGTPTLLPCGAAIGVDDAARCTRDARRTAMFLRGVQSAIETAKHRWSAERIEIVYAGTGPFASLAVPLFASLSPWEVQFTLIDLHEAAVALLRKVIGYFGFEPLVRAIVAGDATAYHHPDNVPLHIAVCETMQRALSVEPQVAIVRHLAGRLHERGILVPDRVCVELVLRELHSIGTADVANDVRFGPVLELTLETARDREYWSEPRLVRIRQEVPPNASAVLVTSMSTHGRHELREYESGLTYPHVLWELRDLSAGEELAFWYEFGRQPKLRHERTPGATTTGG